MNSVGSRVRGAVNSVRDAYNDPANQAIASGYLNRGLAAADSLAARGQAAYNDNISPERRAQISALGQQGQQMAAQGLNYAQKQAECVRRCSSGVGGRRKRKLKSRKNKRKSRKNKRKTRRY